MRGGPQPLKSDTGDDGSTSGWFQAKDGSWHRHRLVDVWCPICGLGGGVPAHFDTTSCPRCGATFAVSVRIPEVQPPPAQPSPHVHPIPLPPVPAESDPPQPWPVPAPHWLDAGAEPEVESFRPAVDPPRAPGVTWATTATVVAVALVVVIVGVAVGRPDPVPQFAAMHFCTSGSAPSVNLQMKIGPSASTALTNVPNGHCADDERFAAGSTLSVSVWNSTGVGEVTCRIVRDGHDVASDRSVLRTKPATCRARA